MKNVLLIGMLLLASISSKAQEKDTTIKQDFVWTSSYIAAAGEAFDLIAKEEKNIILLSWLEAIIYPTTMTMYYFIPKKIIIITGSSLTVIVALIILNKQFKIIRLTKNAAEYLINASKALVKPKTSPQP